MALVNLRAVIRHECPPLTPMPTEDELLLDVADGRHAGPEGRRLRQPPRARERCGPLRAAAAAGFGLAGCEMSRPKATSGPCGGFAGQSGGERGRWGGPCTERSPSATGRRRPCWYPMPSRERWTLRRSHCHDTPPPRASAVIHVLETAGDGGMLRVRPVDSTSCFPLLPPEDAAWVAETGAYVVVPVPVTAPSRTCVTCSPEIRSLHG